MPDFRLDEAALTRLIERYESLRDRNGMGSMLRRVTPGQRVDAWHICMAAYASGRVPEGDQRAFWLAHLRPVLAETREAAAALKEAFDGLFGVPVRREINRPFRFVTAPRPAGEDDQQPDASAVQRELWKRRWRKFWQRWRPSRYAVAAMVAVLAAGTILALSVALFPRDDGKIGPAPLPLPRLDPVPALPRDPKLSAAQGEYQRFLAHTLNAVARYDNQITPHALAAVLGGVAPQLGEPSFVLAEMMRRFPLDPAASIPRSEFGATALRQYAAVAAALSLGTSIAAIDQSGADDAAFANFISSEPLAVSRFSPETWPWTLRFLPFVVLIPGLVWAFWGAGNRRRDVLAAALHSARTSHASFRRAEAGQWGRSVLLQSSAGLPPLPSAAQTSRKLMRLREIVPDSRLDIDKSVRASLASAGDVVTVMRDGSKALDIVFLVRRRDRHDHERARVLRLLDALSQNGVSLTAYDYAPDPRTLTATSRADAAGGRSGQRTLNLRGLRELHAGALLVIVTDGDELIDQFSQRPHAFVKDELRLWPARMMLTPVPTAEWGEREMKLAAALDGPIGRASMAGLAALALGLAPDSDQGLPRRILNMAFVRSGFFERIETWSSAAATLVPPDTIVQRPACLTHDELALLQELAPPEDRLNKLIVELKSWLGGGFLWFAACGIYPQLRVDLTLWLGERLRRFGYADNPKVYSEELFDRLCLLPWFRAGYMPDWLRGAAFAALSDREKKHARQVIDELASGTGRPRTGATLGLQVWQADWREQPLGSDDVMLDFQDDAGAAAKPPADEDKVANDAWWRWFVRGAARIGVVALWAALATWLSPAFHLAPHAPGAWLPLMAFVGASVLLLVAGTALNNAGVFGEREQGLAI